MTTQNLPRPFAPSAAQATLVIAACALCTGLVPLFARTLQAAGLDAAAIAFYRFAFSALVLLPCLPLGRRHRRQAALLFGAGTVLGLGAVGYFRAVETVPVAAAGVIYMSYPVFTILLAWILLGQRPTRRSLAAAGLVLTAALLMMGETGEAGATAALLLAVPAPLTFGLVIVVVSSMAPDLRVPEKVATVSLGAIVGLLPLVARIDPAALIPSDGSTWGVILAMGTLTALLPNLAYSVTAPHVGPARAAMAGAVELPMMVMVGWIAFAEHIGAAELVATILILGAMTLAPAVRKERRI